MLKDPQISSSPWQRVAAVLGLVVILGVAMAAFCAGAGRVFHGGAVYFVDGDCYNRMVRVERVAAAPLTPLRFHEFENYPAGVTPHTTAPLDYAILAVATLLRPFSADALSLAGAVISPLFGLLLLVFLWLWAARMRIPWRGAMLLLLAASPMTAHAFAIGRPDHQSLIVLLLGIALAAEVALWRGGGTGWRFASAAAWGLGLWVSLFEPLILLGAVALARLFRPKHSSPHDRRPLAMFAAIVFLGFLWDGWRAGAVDPAFGRWAATIGELGHGSLAVWWEWTGGLCALVPLFLLIRGLRSGDPELRLWGVLLVVTAGLSLWHLRWGYFFVLVLALALPWAFAVIRRRRFALPIFLAAFWPIAGVWDTRLDTGTPAAQAAREHLADEVLLREAAGVLKDRPRGGVLAPWWLSPAVVWWSGQPCLGGTAHQSLPGTMDGARFYLETDPAAAQALLAARKVRYIIAYEPERVLSNAEKLTGTEAATRGTMAEVLYHHPARAPAFLRQISANRFFRVYEVSADGEKEEKLSGSLRRPADDEGNAPGEPNVR